MKGFVTARGLIAGLAFLTIVSGPANAATRAHPTPPGERTVRPAHTLLTSLCSGTNPERVSRLTLTRSRPPNPERFSFPAVVESSRTTRIRDLATIVCHLPRVSGVYHCPLAWSATYALRFSVPAAPPGPRVRVIHYDPTGCSWISGAGPTRWSSPAFVSALGAALGLRHANVTTFTGTLTRS